MSLSEGGRRVAVLSEPLEVNSSLVLTPIAVRPADVQLTATIWRSFTHACMDGDVRVLWVAQYLKWDYHSHHTFLHTGPLHMCGDGESCPSLITVRIDSQLLPQMSVVWMVGPPARSGGLTFLWSVVVSQHMGQLQLCLSHSEWKELCFPSGQYTYSHERERERQWSHYTTQLLFLSALTKLIFIV